MAIPDSPTQSPAGMRIDTVFELEGLFLLHREASILHKKPAVWRKDRCISKALYFYKSRR